MKKKLHIAGLLIMICYGLHAEDHFFRHYSADEGLLNPYIYAMTQDTSGYLWIGTGEGLFRFDGFNFESFESDSGLMNSFISALHTTAMGAVLIGQQDGSLAVWHRGKISSIYVPLDYTGMVTGITEDSNGNCWISHQGGSILRVTPDFVVSEIDFPGIEENISGILHLQDDMFLIGSFEGLVISRYSPGESRMSIVNRIDQFPSSKVVEMIMGPGNTVYILSQDEGIYKVSLSSSGEPGKLVVLDDNRDGMLDNLQGAVMDAAGSMWIASMGGGILVYEDGDSGEFRNTRELNTENGLITNDISQVLLDDEGNLWLGTYGRGILRYVQNQLSFHNWTANDELAAAWSLALHEEGLSAFGKGICSLIDPRSGELLKEVKLDGLPESAKITASYMDPQGIMWLGTESSGMYVRQGSALRFRSFSLSDDELSRSVNHISGDGINLWVSTKRGLCQVNLISRELQWFTTESGLPHNNIMGTCIASGERVYIATICKEVYYIDREGRIGILENSSFGSVVSIASVVAESDDQTIWLATEGYGVWKITQNESTNYAQNEGLVSDYCYSIIYSQGRVLVTHRGGLSVIDDQRQTVKGFDKEEGLSSSLEFYKNALAVDVDRVWFGTSEGLLSYKLSQDQGISRSPKLNINSIVIDEKEIDRTEKLITLPSGFHDLQIEYVGIDFSSPESVNYRSRLRGYSNSWSTWSDSRTANYYRLSHGHYTFQLEAIGDSGAISSATNVFQINIRKPVYLLFWFWTLVIAGVVALFFLILKIRERALRAQQANLENQLEIRTSEVVKQKEEIELSNKEIRKSMNYASKIQRSIMPAREEFSELLRDYFIFYRPHSIVSGDFYWLNKLDDGRILIVCADATGHGIPGAFMSVIGITLIKEIATHNPGINPGELLSKLDQEVHRILVQKSEESSLPDGMDLSISFLHPDSGKLEVSSAMNSFLIQTSNGPIYQSGTKLSIGGKYFNANKVFENHNYNLSAGDKIYFFSDGYVDQFGGPNGKKFMHSNFRALISEIYKLPMHEQLIKIEKTFDEWKGSENQVDDVLVLGFEI